MQDNDFNSVFDEIKASRKQNIDAYEDLMSNSTKNQEEYEYVPRKGGAHSANYKKKKHGVKKKISDRFYKIRKWWKCMKKGKKRLLIAVTSLFLILLILIATFFIVFRYNYKDITSDPNALGFENVIDKDIINIALFGIDSRDTDGKTSFKGNSDSIMILSINTKSKKVKIISLMRDTLVPIEKESGLTYNKINAAYSWGGPELAIKTINKNFGLDISEYATVNFYGMSDIIDAVGGIDVTLTKDEVTARGNNNHGINDMIGEICQYEKLNPNDYYVTVSGEQHLNGIQAVAYARIRYCKNIWGTSNDYGRTDRQRYVMEQLFNKAKTMSKKQYVTLAKALIPCTETSLSYSQIMGIAFDVMFSSPTFEQYRIPQNSSDMNFLMPSPKGSFGSVVYFDLNYASKLIKAIIYDDMTIEDYVAQYGIEKNDWYANRGSSSYQKPYSSSNNDTSKTNTTSSKKDTTSNTSSVTSSDVSSSTPSDNTDSSQEQSSDSSGTTSDTSSSSSSETQSQTSSTSDSSGTTSDTSSSTTSSTSGE